MDTESGYPVLDIDDTRNSHFYNVYSARILYYFLCSLIPTTLSLIFPFEHEIIWYISSCTASVCSLIILWLLQRPFKIWCTPRGIFILDNFYNIIHFVSHKGGYQQMDDTPKKRGWRWEVNQFSGKLYFYHKKVELALIFFGGDELYESLCNSTYTFTSNDPVANRWII